MNHLSFDHFVRRIYIQAPIEKLYECWASSLGLRSWFLKEAVFTNPEGDIRSPAELVQTGDSYRWEWHNWDGSEKGSVLEANGRDLLSFTFAGNSRVSVNLEQGADAVLVSLRQSDIPGDEESRLKIHHGCSNGWTFWLSNLKAFLEHGILLNETKRDLRGRPMSDFEFVNI